MYRHFLGTALPVTEKRTVKMFGKIYFMSINFLMLRMIL
jgi:hypothetical protein